MISLSSENQNFDGKVELTAIKDIPIGYKDDVIYLYIGTTSTNIDHNTTVGI
jgi:hypothetical protein